MERWSVGAVSGLVATIPMSVAMSRLFEKLPKSQQYPLPPREITDKLLKEAAGSPNVLKSENREALTWLSHFAYGAASGLLYSYSGGDLKRMPIAKGVLAGLTLWSASYMGWLPGLRILKPATEHPWQRNVLMIGVHIVWGAALGLVACALKDGLGSEGQSKTVQRK